MKHRHHACWLILFLSVLVVPVQAVDLEFEQKQLTATPAAGTKEIPFSFVFTNRSTRTITITGIKPTCGCTVATVTEKTYEPGASGKIPVVFTISATMFGIQRKLLQVLTDNPAEPTITLSIEVALPEGPALDRRILAWNQGEALSTQRVTITIPPHLSWTVVSAVDRQQFFVAEVQPGDDPKTITIAVTPRQTERSCIGTVLITFDGGQAMNIFAQVRKAPRASQP